MLSVAACDHAGRVFPHNKRLAVGRAGNVFFELSEADMLPLPEGATLMRLPGRTPVGINSSTGAFVESGPGEPLAAILPQGYTRTYLPAYTRQDGAPILPLFGYCAVALSGDELMVAAMRTDERSTWDPINYNLPELPAMIHAALASLPENRILRHLARCAREYGCFTAQNVFYRRWEGGIPVSPTCNADCVGCISKQSSECCPSPQERIDFVPTVDEVVEVALPHLQEAPDAIISFGQGCEGEPTCQYGVIAESCRRIRQHTGEGTINVNTNAGNVRAIAEICDAGVDSLRVSMASARPQFYVRYHRPTGYGLSDVERSIVHARSRGVFVSLNYLAFPGFSDLEPEVNALSALVERCGVQMIQIRNLNIDPDVFMQTMSGQLGEAGGGGHEASSWGEPAGMAQVISYLHNSFPDLFIGNFSMPVHG
ncbi:MAG: radical SAM protein [Clostridia bacterium]|nr:radical SAM protein [Clostridia bacterium]